MTFEDFLAKPGVVKEDSLPPNPQDDLSSFPRSLWLRSATINKSAIIFPKRALPEFSTCIEFVQEDNSHSHNRVFVVAACIAIKPSEDPLCINSTTNVRPERIYVTNPLEVGRIVKDKCTIHYDSNGHSNGTTLVVQSLGEGCMRIEQMNDESIKIQNRPLSEKMKARETMEEACLRGIFGEFGHVRDGRLDQTLAETKPMTLNAFDMISVSLSFILSGLFEEKQKVKEEGVIAEKNAACMSLVKQ